MEPGTLAHNLGMPSWSGDRKKHTSGDAYRRVEELNYHRGGRRILRPLHPHPSQVPPAAQVGGANLHMGRWKPGEGIGQKSAGGLETSAGRTTGDQTLMEGGGRLNRHGQRGGKVIKEREYGKTEMGKEPG